MDHQDLIATAESWHAGAELTREASERSLEPRGSPGTSTPEEVLERFVPTLERAEQLERRSGLEELVQARIVT